jgi:hypothetical protein
MYHTRMNRVAAVWQELVALRARVDSLLRESVNDGLYEESAHLASIAAVLKRIEFREMAGPEVMEPAVPTSPSQPDAAEENEAQSGYPRFDIDGDDLVKTGASTKSGSEYEHRVPAASVSFLVQAIGLLAKQNRRFSIELIQTAAMDLAKKQKREPLPSYQIYALIAWLKHIGLVIHHGRRGYAVAEGVHIEKDVVAALGMVPRRFRQ